MQSILHLFLICYSIARVLLRAIRPFLTPSAHQHNKEEAETCTLYTLQAEAEGQSVYRPGRVKSPKSQTDLGRGIKQPTWDVGKAKSN